MTPGYLIFDVCRELTRTHLRCRCINLFIKFMTAVRKVYDWNPSTLINPVCFISALCFFVSHTHCTHKYLLLPILVYQDGDIFFNIHC